MQKTLLLTAVSLLAAIFTAGSVQAVAPRPQQSSVVVVPARFTVLQVAFDLMARENIVLVSYQGGPDSLEPRIHVWSGSEWTEISYDVYQEGSFLSLIPARVILVGDDNLLPPALLSASAWGRDVLRVAGLDTASLVGSFGHAFRFNEKTWNWFAKRYNLELRDENAAQRNLNWYERPYGKPSRYEESDMVSSPAPVQPVQRERAPVFEPGQTAPAVLSFESEKSIVLPPAYEETETEPIEPAPAEMSEDYYIK